LDDIERSLAAALTGDRRCVRVYVDAYLRLVDSVCDVVVEARPTPGLTDAPWFRAALEQGAMHAPFSNWVGQGGLGSGAGLALVAAVREILPESRPLSPPSGQRPPKWKIDASGTLAFYRAVVDELERSEAPLERVRAAMGLSRTEFAALFGIRRQALDHWEAGGVPADRREKLAAVEEISDLLLAKLKRERVPGVVRRAASAYGGRSILGAIADDDHELVLAELRDAFDWAAVA
jgi:transcriptional regulator with XRE-family HTH domain